MNKENVKIKMDKSKGFKKYTSLESIYKSQTNGMLDGKCFIFPKIDGMNSSVWLNDKGEIECGSRNQRLTDSNDTGKFYTYIMENKSKYLSYLTQHPNHILYGEFLIPHSFKSYRDDAWRKLYIFDVWDRDAETYIHYDNYKTILDEFEIEYIPSICFIENPSYETLEKITQNDTYLLNTPETGGEGITIKNYDFVNKFGLRIFGKLVRNEFKNKNLKAFPVKEIKNKNYVEEKIIDDFLSDHMILKAIDKIKLNNNLDEFSNHHMGDLIRMVYFDVINEQMWDIIQKYKNPTICFKKLNNLVVKKIKSVL